MLLDCNKSAWPEITIDFGHVSKINRMFRIDPAALELPKDAHGNPITDLHHVSIQEWLLTWLGAPVAVGAVLLEAEIAARKLNTDTFASLWKGEAVERLRAAIWAAWVEYLPPGPRQLSMQLARQIEQQQQLTLEKLPEASELLMQLRLQETEQRLRNGRDRLASSGKTTAGDGEASSESTPDTLPIDSSN